MLDSFHTLSLFPDLFTYQLAAVALLRIFIGTLFVYFGYRKLFSRRDYYGRVFRAFNAHAGAIALPLVGATELVSGLLLVVGLYTQAAAAVVAILALIAADVKLRHPKVLYYDTVAYVAFSLIATSLLFLGPGIFAIDLPL